jgi:hypothetical protein
VFDHALGVFVAYSSIRDIFEEPVDCCVAKHDTEKAPKYREQTDWETWQGLVQSAVACVTAWVVFGLPPFSSRSVGSFKPSDNI